MDVEWKFHSEFRKHQKTFQHQQVEGGDPFSLFSTASGVLYPVWAPSTRKIITYWSECGAGP